MKKNVNLTVLAFLGIILLILTYATIQIVKIRSNEKIELANLNQKFREYVGQRKYDCYQIESQENSNWNNFDYGYYDIEEDACWMKYITEDEENPSWRSY